MTTSPPPRRPGRVPALLVAAAAVLVVLPLVAGLVLLAGDLRTPVRAADRPTPLPLETLRLDECVDEVFDDDDQVNAVVTVVPCDGPHEYRLYDVFQLPGDARFPGDDAVDELAEDGCVAGFERVVGEAYEDSPLDFVSLVPSEDGWEVFNDHTVRCLLLDPKTSEGEGS